jgi:hypothetical protein
MRLEEINTLKLMDHGELMEVAARLAVEVPTDADVFTTADALRLRIIEAVVEQELADTRREQTNERG